MKIHKIDIEFPYDPYPCQMEYMTSVIESLDTVSEWKEGRERGESPLSVPMLLSNLPLEQERLFPFSVLHLHGLKIGRIDWDQVRRWLLVCSFNTSNENESRQICFFHSVQKSGNVLELTS